MSAAAGFTVPADHPSLPGHFPGQPIVPGVVLLDHVTLIVARAAGRPVVGIPALKFLRPVLPGDAVSVTCAPAADGRVAFTAAVAGTEVLRGAALLGAAP